MRHFKKVRSVLFFSSLFSVLTLTQACKPVEEPKDDEEIEVEQPEVEEPGEVVVTPKDPIVEEPEVEDPGGGVVVSDAFDYLDISAIISASVDRYNNNSQLAKTRSLINTDTVDKCNVEKNIKPNDQFGDQISFYTKMMMSNTPAMVGIIGSYYSASSNDGSYYPVSLVGHPLCTSTSSSLSKTLRNVPSQSVIDKLNRFEKKVNGLRTKAIAGDVGSKKELLQAWTKLFSCLGYTESLASSDSSTSRAVASRNAPSGYKKPSGVEFYEDTQQPEVSRLNIGLYQFTPNSTGNIKPCLKAWNAVHSKEPSCKVSESGAKAEMIKIVGSSLQSFNAFCGVHKVIQTFSIQVNTTGTSATHPSNTGKKAEARCVTPNFYAGKAYNHFGPFQNSTGSNMNKLYSCIEGS